MMDPQTNQTNELIASNVIELIIKKIETEPSDNHLWTTVDVAKYLRCSTKTVQNSYVNDPSFPGAIRIMGKGFPKYEPRDVKGWARRYKERAAA